MFCLPFLPCTDDVCEAPAAVIGPGGNGTLHSPQPTSEAVEEDMGLIIGAVIGGLVLLGCCCCCLVCVCCLYKKRNKRNQGESVLKMVINFVVFIHLVVF